jgi:hypothetical protein
MEALHDIMRAPIDRCLRHVRVAVPESAAGRLEAWVGPLRVNEDHLNLIYGKMLPQPSRKIAPIH